MSSGMAEHKTVSNHERLKMLTHVDTLVFNARKMIGNPLETESFNVKKKTFSFMFLALDQII